MTPFHTTHPSTCPSSLPSLDIAAVFNQARDSIDKLELLATPPSFSGTSSDGESNLGDCDVPPFPKDRRPPIFIIQDLSPFDICPGIASLKDVHADEQPARPVLSAPTIPRMNVLMKEPLFIQTWVVS